MSARVETKIDWGDSIRTREADLEQGKTEALRCLAELKETLNADQLILALSDPAKKYFRYDVYPLYKAHRTGGEKPLILTQLGAWLAGQKELNTYVRPSLEADDILGILATHPTLVKGEKVVVTCDKDLLQIPSLHYNPRKPQQGIFVQTEDAADRFFYRQCLSGDATDGVPGCPRIGPVKADKILDAAYDEFENFNPLDLSLKLIVWDFILEAYAAKGKDTDYALQQARCVRILRHTDYDFNNKRPILWTPKTQS